MLALINVPPALSGEIFPSKLAKIGQKLIEIAEKPLYHSSGPPVLTRVSVNTQHTGDIYLAKYGISIEHI